MKTKRNLILVFTALLGLVGCRSPSSPEVQAPLEKHRDVDWGNHEVPLEKYRMVKQGMTRSQVYAILPKQDMIKQFGTDTEKWLFITAEGDVMTSVTIAVSFAGGRVQKITRDVEDKHLGVMTN